MKPTPQPSPELRAKEVIDQMTRAANEVNGNPEEMIDCMAAAFKTVAAFPLFGLSAPGHAALNKDLATLLKLHEMLVVLAQKHVSDLRSARAGSASASVFKPRF